ncbi:unnamed protein product, partial [Vitis vinifera]|uniref:Uncharacterized protein n=1 Tax=Vitis vinifera TaxID=29760 RepID=D7TRT2_VITVI
MKSEKPPYRGSTCYKRRTSPFQNIHIGPHRKEGEKSLFTFTIFRNVSWPYLFIFFKKKKKEFRISLGPGEQIGIRSLERSEVIGKEDCWREISIHYTPFTSKGKTEVHSCAPAEGRSFGLTPLLLFKGEGCQNLTSKVAGSK